MITKAGQTFKVGDIVHYSSWDGPNDPGLGKVVRASRDCVGVTVEADEYKIAYQKAKRRLDDLFSEMATALISVSYKD